MTSNFSNIKVTNIVLNTFVNDSRVLKISRTLANSGFTVRVIGLHDGGLPLNESIAGFEVHRVRLWSRALPKKKFFHALKYVEFMFRVLIRFNDHAIYHCNDLHTLPVGVLLKLYSLGRARIVYDAHEYETEANGVKPIEKKFRRMLEGFLIRYAHKVMTVSDSIADEYVRLYGICKPELILNIPMLSNVSKHDLFRCDLEIPKDKTIFLYQGGLSYGRGLEILLDAFDQTEESDNVIVFMGYGPLEEKIRARAARSDAIFFHPAVPPDDIPKFTSSADVGISTIENTCLSYYYCLPNKLFEYAMAEIPVIVSNMYEMKKLVDYYKLGVVAEDNTVSGIQNAIKEIACFDRDLFSQRIGDFKQRFNWQAQEAELIEVYRDLVDPERAA